MSGVTMGKPCEFWKVLAMRSKQPSGMLETLLFPYMFPKGIEFGMAWGLGAGHEMILPWADRNWLKLPSINCETK